MGTVDETAGFFVVLATAVPLDAVGFVALSLEVAGFREVSTLERVLRTGAVVSSAFLFSDVVWTLNSSFSPAFDAAGFFSAGLAIDEIFDGGLSLEFIVKQGSLS